MNKNENRQYGKDHPAGKVKIAFTDIDGILSGKYMSTEKFLSVVESTTGFCDVIFGWDSNDVAYDNVTYTGWHTGYPDATARIDLKTFRPIPWEPGTAFFLLDFVNVAAISPRQVMQRVIEKAGEYKDFFFR